MNKQEAQRVDAIDGLVKRVERPATPQMLFRALDLIDRTAPIELRFLLDLVKRQQEEADRLTAAFSKAEKRAETAIGMIHDLCGDECEYCKHYIPGSDCNSTQETGECWEWNDPTEEKEETEQ